MRSLRIEPVDESTVMIDIVCECGDNALKNRLTGVASCRHPITTGNSGDVTLVCRRCEREYLIVSQENHIHVFDRRESIRRQ